MRMLEYDLVANKTSDGSNRVFKIVTVILSILLGLLCLVGFIVVSTKLNLSSNLTNKCKNDTQSIGLCFLRSLIHDAFTTQWDQYVIISLLLTYANVLYHIIIETCRTNVSGLLGQTILQIICIIFGVGPSFAILFIPSYIYFYKSMSNSNKSPVPLSVLYVGLIYVVLIIIIPTYLLYIFSSKEVTVSVLSIILLVSPLGFPLILIPFRLCSEHSQRCWCLSSHRFIILSQLVLFILSVPLFFIAFISLITHWSSNLFETSYLNKTLNSTEVKPLAVIWTLDYGTLFIGLILYVIANEYLSIGNNHQINSSLTKRIISYTIFAIVFALSPSLALPLYIAYKEYKFVEAA